MYRSPAFLLAGFTASGSKAAIHAASIEFCVLATAAGFTGAWLESLHGRPRGFYSRAVVFCLVPASLHLSELIAHTLAGTRGAGRGILISMALSVISSSFCWHTMQRGAMLTSAGAPRFRDDLRRMPRLVLSYLALPFGRRL